MVYIRRVVFVIFVTIYSWACAEVTVNSAGGIQNIVIGIDPEVPESDLDRVFSNLEALFNEASKSLRVATRNLTSFREVVVILSDRQARATKSAPRHSSKPLESPDVLVTFSDDDGDAPFAVQNAGCGEPGLRIILPLRFLLRPDTGKDNAFIREWAKYRYGIFDESGSPTDPVHPVCYMVPGSSDFKVTDCTDGIAKYIIKRNERGCTAEPVRGLNDHIEASIMTKMNFPNSFHFCDDKRYPHNRLSPSKQNALCQEQSTWSVISQHSDFKFSRKLSTPDESVSFKYTAMTVTRMIVTVDTSRAMTINARLDNVRNAFAYFTLYTLPEGSILGVQEMTYEGKELLVTLKTRDDADRIIDFFPETFKEAETCIPCAIKKALQVLKINSHVSGGVIVIVSATDIDQYDFEDCLQRLKGTDISLHVIYFKKRMTEEPRLSALSKATNGRFFYIVEDFSPGSSLSSLTLLYEAFRSIHETFSWTKEKHVLVDHKTFHNDSCSVCSLSFHSDSSMDVFQVLVTGTKFLEGPPIIKDTISLTNGKQNFSLGHSSLLYKIKVPAYVFTIKEPKPSMWTLTFRRKPGFYNEIVAIAKSTSVKNRPVITMKSWVSTSQPKNSHERPAVLYTEIKRGYHPLVAPPIVVGTLYHPLSRSEHQLDLFDGGDGDPDINLNDGIFSRYFVEAPESGYYIMSVTAVHKPAEVGWSALQEITQGVSASSSLSGELELFKRVVISGFFLGAPHVGGHFSPRRISDFRVDSVQLLRNSSHRAMLYVLKWTAPGENYDYGTAFKYELGVFSNRMTALQNFEDADTFITEWNTHGPMIIPHSAGTLEKFIIELKNLTTGTYYLALRAVNYRGDFGQVSNIVEVEHTTPTIPSSRDDGLTDPTPSIDNPFKHLYNGSDAAALAIGVTCAILFLLLVLGIVLCVIFVRKRKSSDTKPSISNPVQPPLPALSCSVISPVDSWRADCLLDHYEATKRSKNFDENTKGSQDTLSTVSSINKAELNSSLYASVQFAPNGTRNDLHQSYNPNFDIFNPSYTSSLRRVYGYDNCAMVNAPQADCFYEECTVQRLRTDV